MEKDPSIRYESCSSLHLKGVPVSGGIAIFHARVFNSALPILPQYKIAPEAVEQETDKIYAAVAEARRSLMQLHDKVRQTLDESHALIFESQIMLLDDPLIIERAVLRVRNEHENAAAAFLWVIQQFADQLVSVTKDTYMAARSADILDVGTRVCKILAASKTGDDVYTFSEDLVILATDLSPSDTAQLDHLHVKGFATESGGPTSHTAILARALEIPAVLGLGSFINRIPHSQHPMVIIDGYDGIMIINPTPQELEDARARQQRYLTHVRELSSLRELPAETLDGYRIDLAANIEFPGELEHVCEYGAEGIGLFRTEFMYLSRSSLPTEDELFESYRKAVETSAPYSVIFRTLDLGGDKFFCETPIGKDLNPYLGLRAIRLCLAYPQVFQTQLRAILRASAYGKAKIMFPFITTVNEIHSAREMLEDVCASLRRESIPFDEHLEVGAMIEIPSAALCADLLAREVDFFSIGTNDLIQYTLAVERGNEQIAYLYEPHHPSILRILRMAIEAAQREGIWTGVCGEMAADPFGAILLVGLGVQELSMGPSAIPEIKRVLRAIKLSDARKHVDEIYALKTRSEITSYVTEIRHSLSSWRKRS